MENNLQLVRPYLSKVTWDSEMAKRGEEMYRFNLKMFDPNFIPPKRYRRLIQYFLIGTCDDIPFYNYSIHYLRSLTQRIKTTDDLQNWMNMVNQFPPGTPLTSRPQGQFETFMGVAFYTNPLPPGTILVPPSRIH